MTGSVEDGRRQGSEPAIRAPWPAVAIVALILGGYFVQVRLGDGDWIYSRLGFTPRSLEEGRAVGLVSALFVHGGWPHAILNAVAALAFGAPVARWFGPGAGGVLLFFGFYLACGVAGNFGYALVHWGSAGVLVGASGAISGLMGAASRLLGEEGRGLAPLWSRTVLGMAIGWVVVNLLMAVFGLAGMPVAWEAHLFGYGAGLVGVGPATRWLARR